MAPRSKKRNIGKSNTEKYAVKFSGVDRVTHILASLLW